MNLYIKLLENLPKEISVPVPIITIIGSQSSGKSSIIEKIAGFSFLPKGQNIATRCPIKIYLLNPKQNNNNGDIYINNTKVYRNELEGKIKEEMEKIAGDKKNISSTEIVIHIYKSNILELVLIDLPGIVKIPLEDQPANIEEQVLDLIISYIKQENTIILAVQSVNSDLVTSEALKLAKKYDKKLNRTIGILSKFDLLDQNRNDIDSIFNNKILNLELGYYGVYCTGKEGTNYEQLFFEKQKYFDKYKSRLGISNLVENLHNHLIFKFKNDLNLISNIISSKIDEINDLLLSLGYIISENNDDNNNYYILDLIYKYSEKVKKQINNSNFFSKAHYLNSGAKIGIIFEKYLIEKLKNINIIENISNHKILVIIRNCKGFETNLFVSQKAFEIIIKNEIKKLIEPSINCSNLIYNELLILYKDIHLYDFERFKNLKVKIDKVIKNMLLNLLNPIHNFIKEFFEIEMGFINMQHPDFLNWSKEAFNSDLGASKMEDNKDNNFSDVSDSNDSKSENIYKISTPTKRELNEISVIKKMLICYFEVVKKNICDYMQKIIITKFIKKSLDICEKELISEIYKKDDIAALLKEDQETENKRTLLLKNLANLRECQNLLINFSSVNINTLN